MKNNKNDRNEESLESTQSSLINEYQSVSNLLNRIRDRKKELEDKQRKLKATLSLTKSEISDLKGQLSKIKKSGIDDRYIKKIRDLNEVEECCLDQLRILRIPKSDYDVKKLPHTSSKVINRLIEKNASIWEFVVKKDFENIVLYGKWLIPVMGSFYNGKFLVQNELFLFLMGVALSQIPFICVIVSHGFYKLAIPKDFTSTDVLQEIGKVLNKINKKQNKYKKKLEKKYGVPYEEIDTSANELKKEQILERLQEIEHNMDKLNNEIDLNDRRLQNVREQENGVASVKDYIEGQIGFKIIPGMAEEETAGEYAVEDMPKQYRKTKNIRRRK